MVLINKSLKSQWVFPWEGMIPFLMKNPKDTAGFKWPPLNGDTINKAIKYDNVIYQSYPSLAAIP